MPNLGEFKALADVLLGRDHVEEVSLIQLSTAWIVDEQAVALRDTIDDALLTRFIRGPESLKVRRIVLYDLPERRLAETPNGAHLAWIDRLRRDLAYVGTGRDGSTSYEIRQLVLARDGRGPTELAALGDGGDRFAALYSGNGTFPLTPGSTPTDWPYPDGDPLFYLDLEMVDLDRFQLSEARSAERAPRRRGWLTRLLGPGPPGSDRD